MDYVLVMVIVFHLKIRIQSKHTIFSIGTVIHIEVFHSDIEFSVVCTFLVVLLNPSLCKITFVLFLILLFVSILITFIFFLF